MNALLLFDWEGTISSFEEERELQQNGDVFIKSLGEYSLKTVKHHPYVFSIGWLNG